MDISFAAPASTDTILGSAPMSKPFAARNLSSPDGPAVPEHHAVAGLRADDEARLVDVGEHQDGLGLCAQGLGGRLARVQRVQGGARVLVDDVRGSGVGIRTLITAVAASRSSRTTVWNRRYCLMCCSV